MALISMNNVLFACAIVTLQSKVDRVNYTCTGWTSQGENSKVFDLYYEGFRQLHAIMFSYQKLVNKDIEAMRTMCKELNAMDVRLKDLWK